MSRSFASILALVFAACSRAISVPGEAIESVETTRELGLEDITVDAVNATPSPRMLASEAGPIVVRAQILLDRARFSVGAIDGKAGKNTALALYWFQKTHGLPATSMLDTVTYSRLLAVAGDTPPVIRVPLTADMLKGPFVVLTKDVYEQQKLPCLCYASVTEMLAERFHTTLEIMRRLNPGVGFAALKPGDTIWAPAIATEAPVKAVARIRVAKTGNYVHAFAADGSLLYHFPSTLGSKYDPSPTGRFRVTGIAWNPVFRYDPALFSDIPDHKPKARLPAGPNSPVGVVWIALSRDHIGIHGTPSPESIGSASSHGCVRLTNWDATKLAHATPRGTPVEFTA